jgi:hypothetical protein
VSVGRNLMYVDRYVVCVGRKAVSVNRYVTDTVERWTRYATCLTDDYPHALTPYVLTPFT